MRFLKVLLQPVRRRRLGFDNAKARGSIETELRIVHHPSRVAVETIGHGSRTSGAEVEGRHVGSGSDRGGIHQRSVDVVHFFLDGRLLRWLRTLFGFHLIGVLSWHLRLRLRKVLSDCTHGSVVRLPVEILLIPNHVIEFSSASARVNIDHMSELWVLLLYWQLVSILLNH